MNILVTVSFEIPQMTLVSFFPGLGILFKLFLFDETFTAKLLQYFQERTNFS